MASNDYQFKDGKVCFPIQAASQQYLRLAQSIKDNGDEMEAFIQRITQQRERKSRKFGR
jgi:hypothetical protein